MRFHRARQGRSPRGGRAAVYGCVIGIGFSRLLYPAVQPAPQKPLNTNPYPGVSVITNEGVSAVVERIAVTAVRGAGGPVGQQRMTEFLKLLIEIGNEEIRKGAAR